MQVAGRPNGQHKRATAERWLEMQAENNVSCVLVIR